MILQRATHIAILFLMVSLPRLCAQDGPDLPKYFPSYSNDFSDYRTFPSSCMEDAFWDRHGKLWLKTCGISVVNSLHLFQFDGYGFRLVRGAIKNLDQYHKIIGLYDDDTLIGYKRDTDDTGIFAFDFDTEQLRFYPFKPKGQIVEMTLPASGEVLIFVIDEDQWLFYTFINYEYKLLKKVNAPFPYDRRKSNKNGNFFYQQGRVLGLTAVDEAKIWFVDLASDSSKTLDLNDFIPGITSLAKDQQAGHFRFTPETIYYVKRYLQQPNQFFEFDYTGQHLVPVQKFPVGWHVEDVFWDRKGNTLFLCRDTKNRYRAMLEDASGLQTDYSAFFADQSSRVRKIKSADFRHDLLICHEKGITYHMVKAKDAIRQHLPSESTRAMAELTDDRLLVSTQSQFRKYVIDRPSGKHSLFPVSTCELGWTRLIRDKERKIWTHARNNLVEYDPIANTCEKYPVDCRIFRLFTFIDDHQLAIVSNDNFLMTYNLKTRETIPFLENGQQVTIDGFLQEILVGKNGYLWIASSKGLRKIDLKNNQTETIGQEAPFLDHRFLCMEQDKTGRLWLGTSLGGLHIYDPVSGEVTVLNSAKGLANNSVVSIVQDDEGVRWLGTYNGISLVSPDGQLIANIYQEDGLIDKECNRYSTFKARDGKLFIGTTRGLNEIDPVKIKEKLGVSETPKIYLTSLGFHDPVSKKNKVLEFGLNKPGTIQLPASKRFLNLSFATSNHFKPQNNRYAYLLEGVNEDWKFIGNQQFLTLNNLPAGKYQLLVKATTGFNKWTPEPLVVNIYAKEFFYKKVWFYALLATVFVGIALLWIVRLRTAVKKATHQIKKDKELIEEQAEKLKELDVAKSRFFTNISHEFRTPLTIIAGMIGQIKKKPEAWLDKGVRMIEQNTENLLHLINQILDLRKLESSELQTKLVYGDIVSYLEFVSEPYQSFGHSKGIQMHFLAVQPVVMMDYDPQKMLRVISNLLSNAFKYVPENGNIYLTIDQKSKGEQPFLEIQVKDTGTGIATDRLPFIFDRFYQVDDSTTREREGSGIGLSLTRELINLLGGTIEVASSLGKGTTFTILLPITDQAAENQENLPELSADTIQEKVESEIGVLAGSQTTLDNALTVGTDNEGPTVLVVEDNPDVAQYIIACLEDSYLTEVATDGQKGIDKGIEMVPDLIISDVMMPFKDGFELCHALKTDERTSHVPIVLLTAKSDTDSKISGWKRGADAYLTKPFEPEELLSRLDNLLENRKKLQQRFANITVVSEPINTNKTTNDEFKIEDAYLQKVVRIVSENLSDQGFGIAHLCRALGMGRSQVHNKIKALTGKSTSLFIRSIRLQKARQLLQTTDMNVSEVAYEVGFKYPSHFTKFYSEEFNELPKEVK